jgi:heme-degrading monooxygenase HmoA
MLLASWQVRRQLTRTAGLVHSASLVAGPTEFWTITVWRSRHAMQEFMRSGAHGRIM